MIDGLIAASTHADDGHRGRQAIDRIRGDGPRGTLKAVGGSIVGFLSNPITLAMLAFGVATEAARKLFEVIGAGAGLLRQS